jgi:Family of unknown function (DUF6527)
VTGVALRGIDVPDWAFATLALGADDPVLLPGDTWHDHGCWCVVLPNLTVWYSGIPAADGSRWTITGDGPESLTVTPSINDQDPSRPWHGWIRNGELVPA